MPLSVEVVQSEFEIFLVANSVGLPFESFDFVVDPLDYFRQSLKTGVPPKIEVRNDMK